MQPSSSHSHTHTHIGHSNWKLHTSRQSDLCPQLDLWPSLCCLLYWQSTGRNGWSNISQQPWNPGIWHCFFCGYWQLLIQVNYFAPYKCLSFPCRNWKMELGSLINIVHNSLHQCSTQCKETSSVLVKCSDNEPVKVSHSESQTYICSVIENWSNPSEPSRQELLIPQNMLTTKQCTVSYLLFHSWFIFSLAHFSSFDQGVLDIYNCPTVAVSNSQFSHNVPAAIFKPVPFRGHSPALSIGRLVPCLLYPGI